MKLVLCLWRNSCNPIWAAMSLDITHTHTHSSTPLCEWSACRRSRYLRNTNKHNRRTFIFFSGIRTNDTCHQADAELRLRPHCRQDRRNWLLPALLSLDIVWAIQSHCFLCISPRARLVRNLVWQLCQRKTKVVIADVLTSVFMSTASAQACGAGGTVATLATLNLVEGQ
jgi:hypothetical protein